MVPSKMPGHYIFTPDIYETQFKYPPLEEAIEDYLDDYMIL